MAKAHALAAALLLVMSVSLAALEGVHGVCGMSNDEFKLCQPATAVNNPTDMLLPWPRPCSLSLHLPLVLSVTQRRGR
ncbi:hypothetical protein CFC21_025213 [Triticum aestivum]|uniref:Uncharacterized protein n=2 Tax=Triticum aestivum TaxID=4565 RepID=A0A9R1EJF4_WHEAT|nr:hypothetical protein CFC21_025213 [Triticum aestivum]